MSLDSSRRVVACLIVGPLSAAPGGAFAGQGYALGARYAGDESPGVDSNDDGYTFNGDFGTIFDTWTLRYFDWSLSSPIDGDPGAIPASTYSSPGWAPFPDAGDRHFDPPRPFAPHEAYWQLWNTFRQQMVWRYNLDFARWITTSADPATGVTVGPDRWFSYQIPADYLFGHTPENPDFRLFSSASSWRTADIHPYGSVGVTAFSVNLGDAHASTLERLAPEIHASGRRWAILEWNPSVPETLDPEPYRREARLAEQYRASVLVPFAWDRPDVPVQNTGFEVALRELVQRLATVPLTLSRTAISIGMTSDGAAKTPAQVIRVSGDPGSSPAWTVSSASYLVEVQPLADGRSFSVVATSQPLSPGEYMVHVIVATTDPAYSSAGLAVTLRVTAAGASSPPVGVIDTPAEGAQVRGEVPVTGWAIDDIGIAGVDVYRSPLPGEPTRANGLVFVGDATLVEGARPDVQAGYPQAPMHERAGWGYMLLTNMLPNGGNGPFTLWAIARDVEGRSTTLGSRQIHGANSTATLPFGTLDTPRQGETVSGTIPVFGWALTPPPYLISLDGSSIHVVVDNAVLGSPAFNLCRGTGGPSPPAGTCDDDIATLFGPGYQNISQGSGAIGVFMLDTTTLSNGVHTIQWVVYDSNGNGQGIGSRYFTVANP